MRSTVYHGLNDPVALGYAIFPVTSHKPVTHRVNMKRATQPPFQKSAFSCHQLEMRMLECCLLDPP